MMGGAGEELGRVGSNDDAALRLSLIHWPCDVK